MSYEHIREFTVKYSEADFKDELKLSAMLSYFEEAASSSADELGFGYSYLKPRGYAFMVAGLSCEFISPIYLGERACVKTWPTPPTRVVFGREYQLLSCDGQIKANASARWCLIDLKDGKILSSKAIDNQDYTTYNTAKTLSNVRWKLPVFKKEGGELKFALRIANSEYDHNMHVNNIHYADYCLNCFSVAELKEQKLKKFTIAYTKQCKEGDVLRFYRQSLGDGNYCVQGFNESDEVVTQAQIIFEE